MYFKGYELKLTLPAYEKNVLLPNHENCWFWLFKSQKNKTLSKKELILQPSPAFSSFKHQKNLSQIFPITLPALSVPYQKPLVIPVVLRERAFPGIFGAYHILGKRYSSINNINPLNPREPDAHWGLGHVPSTLQTQSPHTSSAFRYSPTWQMHPSAN